MQTPSSSSAAPCSAGADFMKSRNGSFHVIACMPIGKERPGPHGRVQSVRSQCCRQLATVHAESRFTLALFVAKVMTRSGRTIMTDPWVEHPDTIDRAAWIRQQFETDPEYAFSLVDGHLRDLAGELAASALARFIPAKADEPAEQTLTVSERRYEIRMERLETFEQISVEVPDPVSWDSDRMTRIASAAIFGKGKPFIKGQMSPNSLPQLFDFLEGRPTGVDEPRPLETMPSFCGRDVDDTIAADGGSPGTRCRALVASRLHAIRSAVMKAAAERIVEIARIQRDNGLVWGSAWLAYDDTDKRSTSVACDDGRIAVLHENIDLMSDWSAFVSSVALDADGVPVSVETWMMDRYEADVPAAVEAFSKGATPPMGIVRFALDLRTGALEQPSDLAGCNMESTVWYGTQRDLEAMRDLASGTLEMGRGNEIRTSFEAFEPQVDEDDVDEDAVPAP
jgi:hypothetical protein